MAIAAIETELSDVKLVAVRDRLHRLVAHVRVPRRKVVPDARDHDHRSEGSHDCGDERQLVPTWGKNLCQWLGLLGVGGQLPRPQLRDGTVMTHPRAPREFGWRGMTEIPVD